MTPEQAIHRFYLRLAKHFHHGHENGILTSEYRKMLEELSETVTGDND